jgi:uncharacterized membrane protein (DUF106 family)
MANSQGAQGTQGSNAPEHPVEQPELCGGTTGFVIIMMISLFIMFDLNLRRAIALALDPVFSPIFSFGGKYPGLTLLCTGIFLVFCSTTIRHLMTDWVEVARSQKLLTAFQKERTDAMISGNTVKQKRLEEMAPEIQQKQMVLMISNFKPVIFTMLFFIVVFPWIWMIYFKEHLLYDFFTLPWATKWDLQTPVSFCGGGNIGNWIFIYILISFPIGFLIQNGLKFITFTRKIKHSEVEKEHELDDEIKALEDRIISGESKGIQVARSKEIITQVEQNLTEKNYSKASELLAEAESYLERKSQTHGRVMSLIAQAETMLENAEQKGVNITTAQNSLAQARKAIKRNDDTTAIYYAKQSQRQVKESRAQHKNAEDTLASVKAIMYDLREINTEDADKIFNEAESAMVSKDYTEVVKQAKATKHKAEEIKNLHSEAASAVAAAKSALDNISHLELKVPKANDIYDKANRALTDNKYQEALELATQCTDLINAEKDKFTEAQESVSFAKLVIANALSFGATVVEAEELVANAEIALADKNYDKTIKLATKAKDIAEQAKRHQQRISKRK